MRHAFQVFGSPDEGFDQLAVGRAGGEGEFVGVQQRVFVEYLLEAAAEKAAEFLVFELLFLGDVDNRFDQFLIGELPLDFRQLMEEILPFRLIVGFGFYERFKRSMSLSSSRVSRAIA